MSSTKTTIEWTSATWNVMTGCTQISAGCDHCYAKTLADRKLKNLYLAQSPARDTPANRSDPFAPRFWEERLHQPLRWKRPMRIFVNSMSDVFHAQFSIDQIRRLFEVMHEAYWHQFQVLTKRPERAARLADELPWGPNVWLGTSIEDMRVARRADALREVKQASVRFISAEPLLGSLRELNLDGIDWVIGGGESGAGYRRCDPEWARELRDRCVNRGIAFFWKQWGGHTPKAGGRVLDEALWDEYPVALSSTALAERAGS